MQHGDTVYALAVIGSGPAGLSAVTTALRNGLAPDSICLCERAEVLLGGWRDRQIPALEPLARTTTWHTVQGGLNDHTWLEALEPSVRGDFPQGNLSSLRETILTELLRAGVRVRTGAKALEIGRDYNGDHRAWFESGVPITARRLIVATGGGKNHGYRWAEEKALGLQPFIPAGINLKLAESRNRTWAALVSTPAQVVASTSGEPGEGVLEGPHPWLGGSALTELTLRNPSAFFAAKYKGSLQVNWLCSGQEGVSSKELAQYQEQAGRRDLGDHPWPMIGPMLWNTLLQRARLAPDQPWRNLSSRDLQHLASHFTRTQVKYDGYRLDRQGGLAAGGLSIAELVPGTYESRREPGLFWIGELVDLHASNPNANLWLAHLAGKSAADAATQSL